MDTITIVVKQTIVMFLLMGLGYVLFKKGKITKDGSRDMASLLVNVIIPVVIVNSFITEFSKQKALELLVCTGLALLVLGISVIVSGFIFKKSPIDNFATSFSNPGFFGIPLTLAALGSGAVFYITPFIAAINIMQVTYGVRLLAGKRKMEWKKILFNPIIISVFAGVAVFLLKIPVPEIIQTPLGYLGALNTPVAMLVMGVYLAQADVKTMFNSKQLYRTCLTRLFLIPILTLGALVLIPVSNEIRLALLIVSACPVGANVAVYAQLSDADYPYAVKTVVLSTMLCIVSLPVLLMIAGFVF